MRLIIEARLEDGETSKTETTTVAVVERKDLRTRIATHSVQPVAMSVNVSV
jgi:hypothetical protein